MSEKKNSKTLVIYFCTLGAVALGCLFASIFWQPFSVESVEGKELTTYSIGLAGTYIRSANPSEAVKSWIFVGELVFAAVVGYMLGSINFAIVTSKALYNDDIRKYGSKNAGMTNMFRVYGKKGGLNTLLGDSLKTAATVFSARLIGGESVAYLAAMFCVLGHIAPAKYKFKGGKGVLSSAIAILCLDPAIFGVLVIIFAVVLLIWRYVSLASVISAFAYPAFVVIFTQIRQGRTPDIFQLGFAIFVGLFVIFSHRTNLERINQRTESKIFSKKSKKPQDDESESKKNND